MKRRNPSHKSGYIKTLNGIINFLLNNIDTSKYRISVFYNNTYNTYCIDIMHQPLFQQEILFRVEWYPTFNKRIEVPRDLLKANRGI